LHGLAGVWVEDASKQSSNPPGAKRVGFVFLRDSPNGSRDFGQD
jgi:hypothetical protein